MDVYLLPTRVGDYFLYGGELDKPRTETVTEPETDSTARELWALARRGYHRLTWRRRQKELLLKSLGALEGVRILYPSSLSDASVRRIYEDLIQEQIATHKKWMVANTAALPVAVPLSLIPGPNLLLAYLAWRSVSHYRTKKAGEKAAEIHIDFVPESLLAELADLVARWPFRARRRIRDLGQQLGVSRLDRMY